MKRPHAQAEVVMNRKRKRIERGETHTLQQSKTQQVSHKHNQATFLSKPKEQYNSNCDKMFTFHFSTCTQTHLCGGRRALLYSPIMYRNEKDHTKFCDPLSPLFFVLNSNSFLLSVQHSTWALIRPYGWTGNNNSSWELGALLVQPSTSQNLSAWCSHVVQGRFEGGF